MENIVWLKELNKNNVNIAGVKGAYLADLYNKNFPVPNGFVISAEAFKEFMHSNSISGEVKKILKNLDLGNLDDVSKASEKIKNLIMNVKISSVLESEIFEAYENLNVNEDILRASRNVLSLIKSGRSNAIVSVRSSSIFDIPGACRNILGVLGNKNLINSIKECWSSVYSVGNILNMEKNNFDNSLAVLVQKLVDTNKSGIVLSSNPMNRENEMIIEASFGLGQSITAGDVTPDIYIIDSGLKVKGGIVANKKLKLIRDLNNNEVVKKKLI
ncbi:MAG: PEP/pyruvate-binding domain-containing protein, partial [Nanoarchaeota archaeon]